jgi:CubicO group peptidase (beta-lactamase class C family)
MRPIQDHKILTAELDQEIRHAMQKWNIPQAALLYMNEFNILQRVTLSGKQVMRKLRRCKWSVKMYGPKENRGSMETAFNIGQVADFFTAYAIHLCLKRAHLGWTTLVRDILPDFCLYIDDPNGDSARCTLADIASHRSGIGAWPVALGHATRDNIVSAALTLLKQVPVIANLPAVATFRSSRYYSPLHILLLQHIVEVMDKSYFASKSDGTSRSYEEFCQAEMFGPLGLDATFTAPQMAMPGYLQSSEGTLLQHEPQECLGGLWMTGSDMVSRAPGGLI